MNQCRLLLMTLMLAGLTLGPAAQGQTERFGEPSHERRGDIELFIDATPLLFESARRQRGEEGKPAQDTGPSICRQADKTTWSTRAQPCPDPKAAERREVWSTSSP